MCKSESIKVYDVTKEAAEKLKLDSEKRNKLNIEINITTAKNSFEIKSDKYVPFSDLKIEQQYLKHLIKKEINELCKKTKGTTKYCLLLIREKYLKMPILKICCFTISVQVYLQNSFQGKLHRD